MWVHTRWCQHHVPSCCKQREREPQTTSLLIEISSYCLKMQVRGRLLHLDGENLLFSTFLKIFQEKFAESDFCRTFALSKRNGTTKHQKSLGSLAQLVQSVCLTSRGSGVRLPQLPQKRMTESVILFYLCFVRPTPISPDKTPVLPDAAFFEYADNGIIAPTASRHVNTPVSDRQSRAQSQGCR